MVAVLTDIACSFKVSEESSLIHYNLQTRTWHPGLSLRLQPGAA
jgi:hypothetical protein